MNHSKTSILFTGLKQTSYDSLEIFDRCQNLVSDLDNVDHIFFYLDAVNVASQPEYFAQWHAFKQQHNIDLIACSTVAKRRHTGDDEHSPFELAGLSEFYSRLHHCKKLVQI